MMVGVPSQSRVTMATLVPKLSTTMYLQEMSTPTSSNMGVCGRGEGELGGEEVYLGLVSSYSNEGNGLVIDSNQLRGGARMPHHTAGVGGSHLTPSHAHTLTIVHYIPPYSNQSRDQVDKALVSHHNPSVARESSACSHAHPPPHTHTLWRRGRSQTGLHSGPCGGVQCESSVTLLDVCVWKVTISPLQSAGTQSCPARQSPHSTLTNEPGCQASSSVCPRGNEYYPCPPL